MDGRHFVDNASLRRFLSIQKFLFDAHATAPMRPDFVYLVRCIGACVWGVWTGGIEGWVC